jgi:hypothetical protein
MHASASAATTEQPATAFLARLLLRLAAVLTSRQSDIVQPKANGENAD